MVRNLVFYNVKAGTSPERVRELDEAPYKLFGALPYVRQVHVGRSFPPDPSAFRTLGMAPQSDATKAYSYFLCVDFDDQQGHRLYMLSDEHYDYVAALFAPLVDSYAAFVYEAPDPA